ncbi:hypothetical protein HK405_013590 [Cladochytrium tenue]|nr:hypothetical protein HK405_013590 [Cladochytrium tenue]
MAEAVFKHLVAKEGLQDAFPVIDSAGTAGYHEGETPDSRSVATCRKNGVPVDHRAQRIQRHHFDQFDYILCMDESNLSNVNRMKPKGCKAVVRLLGDYDPEGDRIIEDPYYGGAAGFDRNFAQVSRSCRAFADTVLRGDT